MPVNYKHPSDSAVIKTEVVCPNDTNPLAILQGGRLVEWMDIAAAVCAQNHAGKICVTASIDSVSFHHPARVGDIVLIKAVITRAFTTSMEIYVEAFAKTVFEEEKKLITEAWFTFVALDQEAKTTSIPAVQPQTELEQKLFEEAGLRKAEKKNKSRK